MPWRFHEKFKMNAVAGSGGGVVWRNSDCGQAANCARWKKKGLIGLVSRPSNRDSIKEIAGGSRYLLTLIIKIIIIGPFLTQNNILV